MADLAKTASRGGRRMCKGSELRKIYSDGRPINLIKSTHCKSLLRNLDQRGQPPSPASPFLRGLRDVSSSLIDFPGGTKQSMTVTKSNWKSSGVDVIAGSAQSSFIPLNCSLQTEAMSYNAVRLLRPAAKRMLIQSYRWQSSQKRRVGEIGECVKARSCEKFIVTADLSTW